MSDNQRITVYGFGYVGKALWRFLKDHYNVRVVDPKLSYETGSKDPEVNEILENGRLDLIGEDNTKYAIICVPTPETGDGACDTRIVEEVIKNSNHEFYLIKSTIPPGTTEQLAMITGKKIAFSPEYIGEGKYEIPFWKNIPHPTDMKLHSFHIFGGPRHVTREFINLWQKIAGWNASYHQTSSVIAEMVKYGENSYLGTLKMFWDEFYEIAARFDVGFNDFKELLLLDGRIGRPMSLIFPDSRGFGGKCLPKDISAIIKAAEARGYDPKFLKEVMSSNKRFRKEKK